MFFSVHTCQRFGVVTRYGHLDGVSVAAGDRVERGQVIGTVGRSGRATGFHLHYEVRVEGRPVDPLAYFLAEAPAGG